MVAKNLVLNKDYPMSMYIPSDGKVGEANSGSHYRELYNELARGKNQLLVPIIMYLDGTAIDSKGHIEICPVSFTTSLFTEKARRDVKAWCLMGYVPDLKNRGRSELKPRVQSPYTMSTDWCDYCRVYFLVTCWTFHLLARDVMTSVRVPYLWLIDTAPLWNPHNI
jgi:hypothetical protein